MRKGLVIAVVLGMAIPLCGCSKKAAPQQNVAMDINQADPSDIEAVPADETSGTPTDQLENGADNADVGDLNDTANAN